MLHPPHCVGHSLEPGYEIGLDRVLLKYPNYLAHLESVPQCPQGDCRDLHGHSFPRLLPIPHTFGECYFPFSWHMYCAHEIASLTRAKLPASIASWILPTRQASHPCSSRARIKIDKISIELSFCRPGPACLRSTWSNNHLPEAYNALIKGLPMGYAIRICNQDMQSGYAIRICNQDMQYQYPIGKPSQACHALISPLHRDRPFLAQFLSQRIFYPRH